MENINHAISRYEHGAICSNCGVLEAFKGDFITAKFDAASPHFPAEML